MNNKSLFQHTKSETTTYIKSPINYIGGKYKLLPQIIPLFPKNINTFVDLFGGSGTVLMNVVANNYTYNDINFYIADIIKGIFTTPYNNIIDSINKIISDYNLSMTNKDGFEKLKTFYNKGNREWIILFTLMCYSFNHQFRFNNNHEYNSSFGKNRAYFSERQKQDLFSLKQRFKENENQIEVISKSAFNMDFSILGNNDFIYLDPPYINSLGNYNDGKRGFEGWTTIHENNLHELLNELTLNNIKWAMSNNLKKNDNLKKFIITNNYTIHYIEHSYSNCNYHKKDRSVNDDVEVLITNY